MDLCFFSVNNLATPMMYLSPVLQLKLYIMKLKRNFSSSCYNNMPRTVGSEHQ